MHYHVVYDITQTQFPRFELFLPVIVGLLGLGFIVIAWRRKGIYRFSFMNAIVPTIGAALVSTFAYVSVNSSYHHYLEVKDALQKSQCEVVEGVVSGFQQIHRRKGSDGRISGEMFTVSEKDFQYYDWGKPGGFHQLGVIRDGMHVRIHYFAANNSNDEKDIARLEIAD